MSKAFTLVSILGSALLIAGSVGATRLQEKNAPEDKRQAELSDATPVGLGVITPQQRAHSKLFEDYKDLNGGKTVRDVLALHRGKDVVIGVELPLIASNGSSIPSVAPEQFYKDLALDSDAVIRGTVVQKTAQITESVF